MSSSTIWAPKGEQGDPGPIGPVGPPGPAGPPGPGGNNFIQLGSGAVTRLLVDKAREIVSVLDFGADPTGVADSTTAIQNALNSLPVVGGRLVFNAGTYRFSSVIINKPVEIIGDGAQSGGVVFTTNSVLAPFFSANAVSGISISGFYATSTVVRTSGKYFDFINTNRVEIFDFFADKYFVCIGIDGGSEIKIDTAQMFDGTDATVSPNSGAILLGETNYTGSIGIDNIYIKGSDPAKQTAFGIRAKFVDVLNLGSNVTAIQCGNTVDLVPTSGQTASLVKFIQPTCDTGKIGLNIAPTGSGRVIRCDFISGWFGQNTNAGVVIDGSAGTVDGVDFIGGELINNTNTGINVFGANAKNIRVKGFKVGGNGIGIRADTGANVQIEENLIGASSAAAANTTGVAIGATVTGSMSRNQFTTNTTPVSNAASNTAFRVFDNLDADINWQSFTPVITAQSGTITTKSGTCRFCERYGTIVFEMSLTITTNGTGAAGVLATLPSLVRNASVFVGRSAGVAGKMLQAYVGSAGNQLVIYNFDGTYPVAAANEVLVITGSYEKG
jgi:hypothetical protein